MRDRKAMNELKVLAVLGAGGLKPFNRIEVDLAPKAFEQWNPDIRAASETANDIGIYDVIGQDFWDEGVTTKRISAALRAIGADQPVTVNINSPGGDLFEGLAIYNLLRQHKGEVTVRVIGIAASAASIIAMAGTRIEIARAGFLMIHNAWVCACGNQNDLRDVADYLAPFDSSMADIYSARTGLPAAEIAGLMNAETYIGGTDAIADGFADDYLPADAITEAQARGGNIAARKMDIALAKAGVPRSERRKLVQDFKSSTHDAAGGGTHNATATDTPSAVDYESDGTTQSQSKYLTGILL